MAIWHEDAVYDTGARYGALVGKAQIEMALRERIWLTFRSTHHWTHNFVADIRESGAAAISNLSCQCALADGSGTLVAATYHDQFAQYDGKWQMTARRIEVHHFASPPGLTFPTYTKA
jgi:hypothetical protein